MSFRKAVGVLLPVLGLPVVFIVAAQVVMLSVPRTARASSGKFLETIGTGVAVGSVLGASTLPFYDQPGSHLSNLAYGASAGAVAGLGVYLYRLLLRSTVDNDSASAESLSPIQTSDTVRDEFRVPATVSGLRSTPIRPTPAVWMPLVSVTW